MYYCENKVFEVLSHRYPRDPTLLSVLLCCLVAVRILMSLLSILVSTDLALTCALACHMPLSSFFSFSVSFHVLPGHINVSSLGFALLSFTYETSYRKWDLQPSGREQQI